MWRVLPEGDVVKISNTLLPLFSVACLGFHDEAGIVYLHVKFCGVDVHHQRDLVATDEICVLTCLCESDPAS
jgi:hypothetical protein